jgi:endonuclease/exonuclease/phosphatase family metal-dependent hydrolase
VRSTQADIVFLQEVLGSHDRHAARYPGWPQTSQYEFLADSMWSDFAYGRNAVYPDGHHGNALLSKYPIIEHRNLDVSITGPERRGLLHCVLDVPGQGQVHAICVHLSLLESHRQKQLQLLRKLLDACPPTPR